MELFLCSALFVIAFLYASVGHGGASGYLAVLSFFLFHPVEISTTALILNILVSAISFVSYKTAGHFKIQLLLPFLVASLPGAFLGGILQVTSRVYRYLLAAVLIYAAIWLNLNDRDCPRMGTVPEPVRKQKYFLIISLMLGAVIGLISGIVGIGGGIFLSAYLLMAGIATTKQSAAVSAPFILINSAAGLLGRALTGRLIVGQFFPYLIAASTGGVIGSYLGARHLSVFLLRKILGLVLVLASFKLLVT